MAILWHVMKGSGAAGVAKGVVDFLGCKQETSLRVALEV